METTELIAEVRRLTKDLEDENNPRGALVQARELVRRHAPRSSFLAELENFRFTHGYIQQGQIEVLRGYAEFLERGLGEGVSSERAGQLDVVNDLLGQADQLLVTSGIHPAAPIVIAGAALEQYLRTLVEAEGVSLGNRKPGMSAFAEVLRKEDLLTKQDVKDITSWAGMRNDAAHGRWEKVSDPDRAGLMIQGVNLFLRQHAS